MIWEVILTPEAHYRSVVSINLSAPIPRTSSRRIHESIATRFLHAQIEQVLWKDTVIDGINSQQDI